MQLNRLSLVNYRSFSRLDVEFDNHLNLIVGWNGTGKSSLLFAIRDLLKPIVRQLGTFDVADFIKEDNVRFEMQAVGTRIRFERRYPVELDSTLIIDRNEFKFKVTKNSGSELATASSFAVEQNIREKIGRIDKDSSVVLPFVALYGPMRNTASTEASLQAAASQQISRRDSYRSWQDALISADDLQTWVIGKTLERLQIISEEGSDSELLVDDELEIVNKTLSNLFWGLKSLRFDLRLRMLMIEFGDGKLLPFRSLSDGQRGFVTLIADICRRMLIVNPQFGVLTPEKTPGILMIDELDIHLHPDWQRKVLRAIRDRFPLLQIFATSHSPQMIGGLEPNEVLLMRDQVVSHPQATFGLDSSRILEDVMEVGAREVEVETEIQLIFKDIEDRNFEDAKKRLASLKSRAPALPEYVRAEALIRRVETIGR